MPTPPSKGLYKKQLLEILNINYYPNKEAALGGIVVSLLCTAYLCGAFITFCTRKIRGLILNPSFILLLTKNQVHRLHIQQNKHQYNAGNGKVHSLSKNSGAGFKHPERGDYKKQERHRKKYIEEIQGLLC